MPVGVARIAKVAVALIAMYCRRTVTAIAQLAWCGWEAEVGAVHGDWHTHVGLLCTSRVSVGVADIAKVAVALVAMHCGNMVSAIAQLARCGWEAEVGGGLGHERDLSLHLACARRCCRHRKSCGHTRCNALWQHGPRSRTVGPVHTRVSLLAN
jgi:hypothetical protein